MDFEVYYTNLGNLKEMRLFCGRYRYHQRQLILTIN